MPNRQPFQIHLTTVGICMPDSSVTFSQQINHAQHQAMKDDSSMLCFGLGINDPKDIFGTTKGLGPKFGGERVFDMPTSENAMTGIGIGAAVAGSRVLMIHQRVDFFLLAMDQLVNNAAKWHYMFNGQMKVPLTVRLIVGRGWGQGPTHAQNLQAWFAHIPGLKVVVPSRTENVAQQLYQSIQDDNPVLFIEHRWLHQQKGNPRNIIDFAAPLIRTEVVRQGVDITLIANSYMLIEVLKAADELQKYNINCEVIDTTCLHEIDWPVVYASVAKTGVLLVCDSARKEFSCGAEIVANVSENCFSDLNQAPIRLGLPDHPEPTSFALTTDFYVHSNDIVKKIGEVFGVEISSSLYKADKHDVPGSYFTGPF